MPERVWEKRDGFAGLIASPIWALVWVLTLGKLGRPLYRMRYGGARPKPRPPKRLPRRGTLTSEPPGICVPPTAQFSHRLPDPIPPLVDGYVPPRRPPNERCYR